MQSPSNVIPCPGLYCCKFYKLGDTNHPLLHIVDEDTNTVDKTIFPKSNSVINSDRKPLQSGTFLDNLTAVPFDPKLDPPHSTACFNCWRTNHSLQDCFAKQRNKFCSNCGRKYVEVEDCPRCAKAYCEYMEEQEHIQARIEVYGEDSCDDFLRTRKEPPKFKPVKIQNGFRVRNTVKKKEFWDRNSFLNGSRTSVATCADKTENVCKIDSFVRGFETINSNSQEKDECQPIFSSHRMTELSKSVKKNEKLAESYESDESDDPIQFILPSKVENGQINCEDLKLKENIENSYNNSQRSQSEDENEELENMIFVDEEDEDTIIQNVSEDNLQAYRHLLSVIKNLSTEAQNVAIRCFVNSQKREHKI